MVACPVGGVVVVVADAMVLAGPSSVNVVPLGLMPPPLGLCQPAALTYLCRVSFFSSSHGIFRSLELGNHYRCGLIPPFVCVLAVWCLELFSLLHVVAVRHDGSAAGVLVLIFSSQLVSVPRFHCYFGSNQTLVIIVETHLFYRKLVRK